MTQFDCFGPEAIATKFISVSKGDYFVGSKSLAELEKEGKDISGKKKSGVPIVFQINLDWYAGKTKIDKAQIVEKMTAAVCNILKIRAEFIQVNLHDQHEDNYFVGGKKINTPAPK